MLGQARQWQSALVYGFAHYGKSLFWYASEILFAYFLTELVGLSARQMAMVIVSGFLVSAAIDLGLGLGLRRRLASAGGAAHLQLTGALLSSLALAAIFVGAWLPVDLRFGHAVAAGIGFRLAFGLYDIPQNALMALATQDEAGRLRVASTRIWFSGAATLTVAGIIGPLIASNRPGAGTTLLFAMALAFAVIAVTGAALLARALPRDTPGPISIAPTPALPWPHAEFLLLIGVMLLTTIFTPAFAKLEPYFASYALRSAWWGGVVILAMASGIVVGQPLWLALCRRMSPFLVMIGAALLQVAALALFWLAGAQTPWLAAAAALAFGLGNGGVGMVQWAAFSETVATQLPGRASLAYGLFTASAKIGLAIGGAVIAAGLDGIDFRGGQSQALAALMAVIPGVGAVLLVVNALALLAVTRSRSSPVPAG